MVLKVDDDLLCNVGQPGTTNGIKRVRRKKGWITEVDDVEIDDEEVEMNVEVEKTFGVVASTMVVTVRKTVFGLGVIIVVTI